MSFVVREFILLSQKKLKVYFDRNKITDTNCQNDILFLSRKKKRGNAPL